jgi:uncharacterized protein (DUF362 family)
MPIPGATAVFLRVRPDARYPEQPPFHPGEAYPELGAGVEVAPGGNDACALVRGVLSDMGLDAGRAGTPGWNPLGEMIRPGMTVLVKPNLVLHEHPKGGDLQCLITHGSVVRAVLDYVALALGGEGRIVVGDSPLQGTDFRLACERSGLAGVVEHARRAFGMPVDLVDFRQVQAIQDRDGNVREWRETPGDPRGYVEFDLRDDSMLAPISGDVAKFRVAKYKAKDTAQYHHRHSHRYVIAGSVLDADVILNVPKLKTHCKAGVTLGLKNFVGTVGRKQCLAHHRHGSVARRGDEYPENSRLKDLSVWLGDAIQGNPHSAVRALLTFAWRADLRVMKTLGIPFRGDGGWHGNDTVWRMALDLVRIALYGRRDGTLADTPRRVILTVLDGIVAGEGEGPLEARPKRTGAIVAGLDPLATDVATAAWMGFDWRRIPLLREGVAMEKWPVGAGLMRTEEPPVMLNGERISLRDLAGSPAGQRFEPPEGWAGHIERSPRSA